MTINTPDVDPAEGLANLPTEPANTEIAQDCQAGGGKGTSRFVRSGSGGLPTNPYEPLNSRDILADVQAPSLSTGEANTGTQGYGNTGTSPRHTLTASPHQVIPLRRVSSSQATPHNRVVEAQGWRVNAKGR